MNFEVLNAKGKLIINFDYSGLLTDSGDIKVYLDSSESTLDLTLESNEYLCIPIFNSIDFYKEFKLSELGYQIGLLKSLDPYDEV